MDTELEKLELTLINLKNEAHENGSTRENGGRAPTEGVREGVCELARREGRGNACSIAKPIHESPSSSPWLWPSGCGSTE